MICLVAHVQNKEPFKESNLKSVYIFRYYCFAAETRYKCALLIEVIEQIVQYDEPELAEAQLLLVQALICDF